MAGVHAIDSPARLCLGLLAALQPAWRPFILQEALPWQVPHEYPHQLVAASPAGAVRDMFSFHRQCQA